MNHFEQNWSSDLLAVPLTICWVSTGKVSCDFPGAEVLDLLLQREPSGKSFKRVLLTRSSSGFEGASTWNIECKTVYFDTNFDNMIYNKQNDGLYCFYLSYSSGHGETWTLHA